MCVTSLVKLTRKELQPRTTVEVVNKTWWYYPQNLVVNSTLLWFLYKSHLLAINRYAT